ncbi:SPFH domain-containing protein [Pseudoalteromonas sp. T1lg65]|uniref:flotillin family protein n=1 Tax=Pseudoalteromonas sp. T1lg65 TaxID=2077101 RepID=UPI003F79D6AE
MEFLNNLGPVLTIAATALIIIFAILLLIGKFYRKVEQGQALIINKMKSEPDVTTTGGIVLPVIHKMEVMDISTNRMVLERREGSGLICKDNIRADIAITFYIRVNENKQDILRVAKQVGCARASAPETLQALFEAKFSEALKTVGKKMNFEELFTHRNEFRDAIKEVIGQDLSGYTLEDVAIDYLEQTSIEKLDPNNILDAEGIRRITEKTATHNVETNQLKCDERAQIEIQNQAALEKSLEIERQKEDASARQKREIESVRAREAAEAERVKQEERQKSEEARLKADEALAIAEQNKQREIDAAEQNRLRLLAIEEEKVARSRQIEVIERERETEILRIQKEKALEVERKEIADVQRDRMAVEKTVAEEQERIKDVQKLAEAERDKQASIIRAQGEAEEALVKDIEAAKAQEQAAEFKAREMEKMAEAELRIANQQAESKKILAEAAKVEAAATGLAEAEVIKAKAEANAKQGESDAQVMQQKLEAEARGKRDIGLAEAEVQTAMADAIEKQGEAEAANLERRMSAEAKGLEEKLQALNAMSKEARDYESFTLQLNQQRELTLANIAANKDIAAHQAQVMAKALNDADINFMGGDGQFFSQFMNAITLGKSIDGFVGESKTMQTMFKDHLNGERNIMDDLKGVLAGASSSAETMKNLNMSKFFQQLSSSSDAEKQQLLNLLGGSFNGSVKHTEPQE